MKKRFFPGVLALVLAASTLLTGCVVNKDQAVITVNGGEDSISVGYAQFVAKYNQVLYDSTYLAYYGTEMWSSDYTDDMTMEEYVKDSVVDQLEEMYVIKQHASEYNVTLTKKEKKQIKTAAKKFMSDNSDKSLKAMGATQEYVEEYLTYKAYSQKVRVAMTEDAGITVTKDEAAQRTFSYVTFETDDLDSANKLSQAADFDATAKELELTVSTESYGSDYATSGSLDSSVYEAANKLSQGQVSSVIAVENTGIYVLRLDSEYDEDATESKMESLLTSKKSEYCDEIIQDWIKDANFKLKKKVWKQVKFNKLFTTSSED